MNRLVLAAMVVICGYDVHGQTSIHSEGDEAISFEVHENLYFPLGLRSHIREAAEQGSAESQFHRGMMHSEGQGVQQSDPAAARWYHAAAEQGHADAQNTLGVMYALGQGVQQDYRSAARWFRAAATQGNARAQFNLAETYTRGLGVLRDQTAAARWYRAASMQGIARAQFNLAAMYVEGSGVPQNFSNAHMWYNISAANGIEAGRAARDRIAQRMTSAEVAMAQQKASVCMDTGYRACR